VLFRSIGAFDTKIALHPDVVVPIKIYVAQTQDEIEALVAGKVLTFGTKRTEEEEEPAEDKKTEEKKEEVSKEEKTEA
jgi:NADH:ubiquinone oxidoreductase subunit B-like Fe-S oxidoreductase